MPSVLRNADVQDWSDERGNRVIGSPEILGSATLEFVGEGNVITFAPGVRVHGWMSFRGSHSTVEIGDGSMFRGRMSLGNGCAISMGSGIYCGPEVYVTTAEERKIHLGDDLLISERCSFRADDSHPIYDGPSGARINPSADIYVGNHVWVGWEAMLLAGSWVGAGSVLGARALVTGSAPIPGRSLAVGTPARILRTDITWVRKHLQTATDIDESLTPESLPAAILGADL